MKVHVIPDLCCGAKRCVEVAPQFYSLRDGFNALVGLSEPSIVPPELEDAARRGASICPECAIVIDDDN